MPTLTIQSLTARGLALNKPEQYQHPDLFDALNDAHEKLRTARLAGAVIVPEREAATFQWLATYDDGAGTRFILSEDDADDESPAHTVRILTSAGPIVRFTLNDEQAVTVEVNDREYVGVSMPTDDGDEVRPVAVTTFDGDRADTAEPAGTPSTGLTCQAPATKDTGEGEREAIVLYTVTAADLDDLAGRRLSNDELAEAEVAIPHTSVRECLTGMLDGPLLRPAHDALAHLREVPQATPIEHGRCQSPKYLDSLTCVEACRNDTHSSGFYPSTITAVEVKPDVDGSWDGKHIACAACGRIYYQSQHDEVSGWVRVVAGPQPFTPLPPA